MRAAIERPFFSKKDASEMAFTLQRMTAHTANASPNFPFFLQNASEILSSPPTKGQAELGAYLASINLSSGETSGPSCPGVGRFLHGRRQDRSRRWRRMARFCHPRTQAPMKPTQLATKLVPYSTRQD